MWRLNVRASQIDECIRTALFAFDVIPRNPPLAKGDPLLLQLTKDDAAAAGKLQSRIEFALIFDRVVPDPTGALSREHWPNAGKTWKYLVVCSERIPTVPFSLERLPLSRSYTGQSNPLYILPQDQAVIRPFLKGEAQPPLLSSIANVHELLATIRNYDKIARQVPEAHVHVREHQRRAPDPWLGDALKVLYDHRCQICVQDFKPRYGLPYADTLRIGESVSREQRVSKDILVVCPNHAAIVPAAKATFDSEALAFRFPNGLVERLTLRDHLL
jgi:hypothetical protein